MSKIKYHKHCRKHLHVDKVKALLTRAFKASANIDVHFYHDLTGVVKEDAGHLEFLIRQSVNKLATKMTEDYKRNDKDLTCEFSVYTYGIWHKLIAELHRIMVYIYNNYPEEIKKEVFHFSDSTANVEEKKRQYLQHYEHQPLIGFNKSFFAIYPDGEKRRLWPITVDVKDLEEVSTIEITYQ